jgi:arabinose-5-phosphate isomerase
MDRTSQIIEDGRRVLRLEGRAVSQLEHRIGNEFAEAVRLVMSSKGRVIVTGVGKSGIIARKIVATLNSTGTPSVFLHPTDAVHGDLGIVREGDVVICISKSGATEELRELMPMFRRIGVPVIAMLGTLQSQLAQDSAVVLDVSVEEEACPHDLAPTSSTTAALAMGDAIAITLLNLRGFTPEDFAMYHPGGSLGKKLLLKVDELMVTGYRIPAVPGDVPLRDAIMEMTTKRIGCTLVLDARGEMEGIITDGDLRRLLQRTTDLSGLTARAVMTKNPKSARAGTLAVTVLREMEGFKITQMVIRDDRGRPAGVIHLHDLVNAGLAAEDAQ